MAKKDDFDDLGFDDVDWDDFDEPPRQNNGKSRNPVLDTANQVRKSALATIWPRGKRDQVILKGMPQPAAEAYKGYQNAAGVAKDVYAHTKDEIVKTERVIKQQARQLGPTLKRYLPDSLTNRINKWARSDEDAYGGSNYDPQQAGLDRMMGEVFGAGQQMTEEQQTEARENATEDRLRDAVREMKSDALMNTVLGIARDVHMQTGLSKGVFLNVQRKQLELQYRTLFALQDIAKLKQTEFDRNTPALEAIVKNTALPDYAKEEFSEIHWANIKRKAAEWMNPLRYGEEFMNNVRDNMTKKISQAFGDGRMAIEMLMGSAIEDDFGMEDGSSLSPDSRKKNSRDKGVGWLTSFLTKKLIGPQLEKVQGKTKKWLEDRPEYMTKLHQAQFKSRGWTNGTISNSANAGEIDGTAADVFRMGRDFGIIDPMKRENVFLDERDGEALNRVAKFDRRAHLALVEVIPAWLSEINKSIRRGYGEHADQEYDITTRGFTTRRALSDRIRKGVADDKGRIRQQETIWEIVNYIDDKKTLDEKARQGLANYLESRISLGRSMDVDAILKDSSHLMRYMSGGAADSVVEALKAKANPMTGGSWQLSNELEDKFQGARNHVKGYQKSVDEAVAIYGERALRDAGIFRYDAKNNTFGADKDFADPFTLFNDTRTGKTRSGKALTLDQEIKRKLKNNSALADLLRRRFNGGGDLDDTLFDGGPLGGGPSGGGGKGKGRGKGMSPVQLARVLYGETETNFVDLLKGTNGNDGTETDRIVEAVRGINLTSLSSIQEKILAHVKSMDEQGVLLASLAGGEGGGEGGSEEMGPPRPGAGPRRRRIVLGETGLLRRWGGILFDTAGGAFNLGKRGFNAGKDRLGKFGSWVRGKFGGPSEGPGIFERMRGFVSGGISGAFNSAVAFGQGLLGIKDIFDEKGNVVLQGKKLENGEYYQMSSNGQGAKPVQLKTLDDIRLGRDIIDSEGNIILSAADLAAAGKLRYYKGGKAQSLFQVIARKGGEFGNKVLGAPKRLMDSIAPRFKSAREWFTNLPDIYVKGDTQPRLYAHLMRQGHYINSVTKQPVYKLSEISGPIEDAEGNTIISASELQNPDFALVDKWGREVKSPLGRIVGRIGRIAGWGRDLIMGIPGRLRDAGSKLKHFATNNPVANWFKGGKGGGGFFNGNTLFGGMGSTRKTNHILIRIYKLLNQRLAGEPEDESWTEEMEKGVSGSKSLDRAMRKGKVAAARLKRRFNRRFGGRIASGRSWFGGKRDALRGWFSRFGERASNTLDSFRGAEHDLGTRYMIEKHLMGRDDDVAAFYRDRLYRKGGFSKAKISHEVKGDVEDLKDAAGNVINTGRKKVQSVGSRVLDRLNKMVDLQEVTWFNTMRSSLEQSGAQDGFVRGMMNKFSRRVKFNSSGEKRDYFQWFRRRRPEDEEHGAARPGSNGKKKGGIMDMFKSLPIIGPIVSILSTVGSIMGTVAKWGIFKPAMGLGKAAWWLASGGARMLGGAAMRGLIMPVASAATAVVATLGWPVTLLVGAAAGLSIAAYRIATSTYTSYLDTMRIAQYGYRDYDKWSTDDGAKVRYLEDQLKQYIAFNGEGQASCRGLGGKEVQELAAGYGVNTEDKGEMLAFQAHMLQRFVPIYLRWLTVLKAMDRDIQLADVGNPQKVTKEEMLAIHSKTALTKDAVQLRALQDPRKVNQGFWSSVWDTVTFTAPEFLDASEVMEVQEDTLREINKRMNDDKNRKMRTLKAQGQVSAGVKDAFDTLNTMDADTQKNYVKKEGWEDGTESIQIQVDGLGSLQQKDVDALESLRMKTYGLKNMDSGNVAMLKDMEAYVLPQINTKTGTYNGKWTEATNIIAPQAWQTPRGDAIHHWFVNRFLPTFMFYVCGFKRYDPAGDPLNVRLTGGYLYELGLLTSRAYNMRAGIRQSVWEVALVPWTEDGANTDPNSVEKELITLKELSKQADLNIRNLLNEKKADNRKIAQWQKKDPRTHIYETTDDTQRQTYTAEEQEKMNAAGGFGGRGYSGIPSDISDTVNAVGGVSKYAQLSTGNVTIDLGDVAEGNYKELAQKYPISSLNNTENVKKMIIDVANSMGVPPGVALGMAYAESKFNYKAKNPYASAAGLFQFVDGTWDGMMNKYANGFGIPTTLRAGRGQYDPHANAILGLQFIRDNIQSAQRDLGAKPPPAVAYLYHFLGAGGGRQFLKAWQKNPNAPATAAASVTRKVLAGNQNVFFTKTGKMRTLNEVMQELNGRMGSVTANSMNADPKLTKELTGGLNPQSSSPAVNAGAAANDPSMGGAAGAANNLPADNANRRGDALATKGVMAADDALAGTGGGSVPGGTGAGGGSNDVSTVGDTVEGQAKADGLSEADAAKVRAAAEQRAQAAKAAQNTAAPSSDMSASAGGFGTGTVGEQQLAVQKEMRDVLKEMRDIMQKGGNLQSGGGNQQPSAGQKPQGSYTQPTPSLNVSRQAS